MLRECAALRRLAAAGVDNAVRCIASCSDAQQQQASIVLAPLFVPGPNGNDPDDTRATIATLPPQLQDAVSRKVCLALVKTLDKLFSTPRSA